MSGRVPSLTATGCVFAVVGTTSSSTARYVAWQDRAETAEEAMHGWRAATWRWHTAEQTTVVEEQGPSTSGPLDEREVRIMQILYNGKGCAACPHVSCEPMP
jgi:hypothetical protein